MDARRYLKPPHLCYTPRSLLDKPLHGLVDSALKDLKLCSRQLRLAMTIFRDELQILDRIYYKGKNQHRSALFWRRVTELRRYGKRLECLNALDVVEDLRYSFFGEESKQNPKVVKGPWTHLPDVTYSQYVEERLSACKVLVIKMRKRSSEAYGSVHKEPLPVALLASLRSFTLAMQSGYFLHLAVALAAITSRMAILLQDIEQALSPGLQSCRRVLQILNPTDVVGNSSNLLHSSTQKVGNAVAGSPDGPEHRSNAENFTGLDGEGEQEDVGISVASWSHSKPNKHDPETKKYGPDGTVPNQPLPAPCVPSNNPDHLDFIASVLNAEPGPAREWKVATPPSPITASPVENLTKPVKPIPSLQAVPELPKKRSKKSRKKLDEIDAIFGF